MRLSLISAATLAMLAAPAAYAEVVYNTNFGPAGANSPDGLADGVSAIAVSFSPSGGIVNQVGLVLSAANPSDGGSYTVYIVPDVSGAPGYTSSGPSNAPVFDSFTNGVVVATESDSTLSSTPTLVDFAVSSVPSSSDGTYWVGLVPSTSSGASWSYNDATQSADFIGTLGQSDFFFNASNGGGGGPPLGGNLQLISSLSPKYGPYELVVTTPEPMSLALLGVGLAGLGVARRRVASKS